MDTFRIRSVSPQLRVADLAQAIRFYTEKLGFNLAFRYEDFYAGVEKDGCSIHLKQDEPSQIRPGDNLDLVFSVDDIDVIYAMLVDSIPDIRQPLREMPYGMEFYVADPDGNILAFVESR